MAKPQEPPNYPLPAVAANVRAAREAAGLSQSQLAVITGIQQGDISRIEHARRDPTTRTLLRIARALRTTPAALLDGIE